MNRLLPLALLLCSLTGCHRGPSAAAQPAVTNGLWKTSRPVTAYEWFIDGRKAVGGSQVEASDDVALTLTRHADGLGYVLQLGLQSGHGSDTLSYDTSIEPAITMPDNGTLEIKGPTSILRFEEHTRDGRVSKTRELFID